MGYNRLTRGTALLGAVRLDVTGDATVADDLTVGDATTTATLKVGSSGTVVKTMKYGSASVDFAEIAAGETGSATFTVTGAAAGDIVVVNPPALTTGLAFAGAKVTAANTVTVYAVNASAGAIDEGAATFTYLWFDLT
jgi:hypothetical protein